MAAEFRLPELGENIETIQVVKILVAVGDTVAQEQPVLELETDKATVEVPSSVVGTVRVIHVAVGDEIKVGQPIFTLLEDGSVPAAASAAVPTPTPSKAPAQGPVSSKAEVRPAAIVPEVVRGSSTVETDFLLPGLGENIETIQVVKVMVAVGDRVQPDQPVVELETDKATVEVPSSVTGAVTKVYVRSGDELRVGQPVFAYLGERKGAAASVAPAPAAVAPDGRPTAAAGVAPTDDVQEAPPSITEGSTDTQSRRRRVPAAPSVRKFAREIGIDLLQVPGTGPQGRVSIDDVKQFARQRNTLPAVLPENAPQSGTTAIGFPVLPPMPEFEKWGPVQRDKLSVIRRKTAEQMSLSWLMVPHVTIFDSADITELESLRKRYAGRAESAGGKLTMSVMVVKVVAQALRVFPRFNASIDMVRREVVYKKYCNVGLAVATDRGLLVPVIHDTDKKNMVQISVEIASLAERARSGKISVSDLEGGTFTVTNLGRVGGVHFTPIINYPEVAILGIGRAYKQHDPGTGREKMILPFSLSFDHRIIDGSDGAAFMAWILEAVEQPLLLSLEG